MRYAKAVVVVQALCAAGAGGGVAAAAAKPRPDRPLAGPSAPLRSKAAQRFRLGPRTDGAAAEGTPGRDCDNFSTLLVRNIRNGAAAPLQVLSRSPRTVSRGADRTTA